MQSHFLTHKGANLHYRIGGQADAPVMVLLHGGFGSIEDFAALLPRLQQHFRVLAIDTRGHGRSTFGHAALTYAQAAEDVRRILQHLAIGQYSLFGFSDGGIIAYRLGAEDEHVQSIITIGSDWHKDHLSATRPMFEAVNVEFVREYMPGQVAAYEAENPEVDLEKWVGSLRAMWLDESESGYPNQTVSRIKAHVLAIRGEADFLYSLADWAALKNELPDVHLMNIPFAAHEVIKEQPEMVWAALQAFQQHEAMPV